MTDRAALRRLAAAAVRDFGAPGVIEAGRSCRDAPPAHTPPADRVIDLVIECQCGHVATIRAKPAEIIGRRLICSQCGQEPAPF